MDISQITNSASVVVSVILAVITFFYLLATRRMVKEMQEARKSQPQPVLTCEIGCNLDRSFAEGMNPGHAALGECNDVIIHNVGNAPAIEVNARANVINFDESKAQFDSVDCSVGIVGTNPVSLPMDHGNFIPGLPQKPQVTVVLTYQNIYKIPYITTATFELRNYTKPTDAKPSGAWIKLNEKVNPA
jgi:hypothetical protein